MPTLVRPTSVIVRARWNEPAQALAFSRDGLHARVRRLDPGLDELFLVRVAREAEAIRYHRLKWYHGYILKQAFEQTGQPLRDLDRDCRVLFLPPDVVAISDMTDDQMRDFNLQCEAHAAQEWGVVITGPNDARRWTPPEGIP